uniref:Uncharacterized protein n=1 Tax=Setaria italica TaxID=4555 RepID=K3Z5X7_SETIT
MRRQPRLGDGKERLLPAYVQPKEFLHAQVLGCRPVRQPPREPMHQVRHRRHHLLHREVVRRAHAPPGPERQQPEVRPAHVDTLAAAPGEEPLRPERVGLVGPRRRVAPHGPHVHQQARAGGDVVAADHRVLPGVVRDEERAHRVQPHRLLHDGLDVGEVRQVPFGDPAGASHHAVELLGGGRRGVRVAQELQYGPLHRRRCCLRAAADDVQEEGLDAITREPCLRWLLLPVLGQLQQHVHEVHVVVHPCSCTALPVLLVLVEDLLVELVEEHMHSLHPPNTTLHVEPAEPRHPLSYIAQQTSGRERFLERSPECFVALGATTTIGARRRPFLPQRHANNVAHREVQQVLLHLQDGAGALEHAARQGAHLLRAGVLERVDAPRGEELGGAELARHAPVGAVGRLNDALVAVAEDLAEGRGRAVGEGEVVGLEDQPRRLLGGGDHDVEGSEPEVHERAVARRELRQYAVWRERVC